MKEFRLFNSHTIPKYLESWDPGVCCHPSHSERRPKAALWFLVLFGFVTVFLGGPSWTRTQNNPASASSASTVGCELSYPASLPSEGNPRDYSSGRKGPFFLISICTVQCNEPTIDHSKSFSVVRTPLPHWSVVPENWDHHTRFQNNSDHTPYTKPTHSLPHPGQGNSLLSFYPSFWFSFPGLEMYLDKTEFLSKIYNVKS